MALAIAVAKTPGPHLKADSTTNAAVRSCNYTNTRGCPVQVMYWNIFHPSTPKLTIPEFHSILRGYETMFFAETYALHVVDQSNSQRSKIRSTKLGVRYFAAIPRNRVAPTVVSVLPCECNGKYLESVSSDLAQSQRGCFQVLHDPEAPQRAQTRKQ
jgi:hypothetical protein